MQEQPCASLDAFDLPCTFEALAQQVSATSSKCRCLVLQGLMVKMITGDQALIGRETAKQLGMGSGGVVNIFNTEVLLKVGSAAAA